MEGFWLLSYIVLWFFVLFEGVILIALARQIGLIHERLGPAGARTMNPGPSIGTLAPAFDTQDFLGRQVTVGVEQGKRTLLLFISTGCSICETILPSLKATARTEKDNLEVILVAPKSDVSHINEYIKANELSSIPLIVSDELAEAYKISMAPYGVIVNRSGEVRAKGLINNLAHLESLLNAEETGYYSIQNYIQEHDLHLEAT
jgi:methylamine dehydrogenase accessory protein MauD